MATEARGWGAEDSKKGKHAGNDSERAPSLPLGNGINPTPVTVRDIDVNKLEIGKEIKTGSIGDRYVELKYDGKRLALQWGEFWEFKRSPFKAGPPKTNPQGGWGMVIEIEQDEYDKWVEVEEKLVSELKEKRNELFEHTLKASSKGKETKKLSVEDFEEKFNSILRPADVDKGYKAHMRISVPHEEFGPDGKAKKMPRIIKANLKSNAKGYGWNNEEVGTIHDLNPSVAVSAIAELSRGLYFGTTGWGMKFTLDSAKIWKNMSTNTRPDFDTSKRQHFPESDDEGEAETKKLKAGDETQVRPFMADALLGYDDGTGGNGVPKDDGASPAEKE